MAMRGNNWECDGWTQIGHPYRSRPRDCRTVRVRHRARSLGLPCDCMGQSRQFGNEPEKPLAWHRDQPGWTPLLLRIVRLSRYRPQRPRVGDDAQRFAVAPESAGKVRRAARVLTSEPRPRGRGDAGSRDAVSQETCHPAWAFRPRRPAVSNAITEVVLAHRYFPDRAAGAPNDCCQLSLTSAC